MARARLAAVAAAFVLIAVACAGSDDPVEGDPGVDSGAFTVNSGAHHVAQIWCADSDCQG